MRILSSAPGIGALHYFSYRTHRSDTARAGRFICFKSMLPNDWSIEASWSNTGNLLCFSEEKANACRLRAGLMLVYLDPTYDRENDQSMADVRSFGSAHPSGCSMVLCDGSVRLVSYDVDLRIHRSMGHRSDGR